MAKDTEKKSGNGDASKRVAFDYIKSQLFRVIRADGAIGGITPSGHIHFALYSERPAIPRREVFEVEGTGLGKKIDKETVSRSSIVREMDCDVIVNVDTAESIARWLLGKVEAARKLATPKPNDKH